MPWGSADQKATAHLETESEAKLKGGSKIRAGPVKPPLNVRLTCRFDYQPDICKDYKETGYCGYGDNCKFLHDRGDYKTGWQLETEWEEKQKNKKNQLEEAFEVPAEPQEELPFACAICRGEFVRPIVTRCGHYFCEECAIERERKSKSCFLCDQKTNALILDHEKLNRSDSEGLKSTHPIKIVVDFLPTHTRLDGVQDVFEVEVDDDDDDSDGRGTALGFFGCGCATDSGELSVEHL